MDLEASPDKAPGSPSDSRHRLHGGREGLATRGGPDETGVPIPAFYCKKCGTYHITDATIKAVSDLFRKEGSDAWYKYEAEQIIPAGEVCEKCGASEWTKDTDIMDVWFDSGSTHAAVLEELPSCASRPICIWRAATSSAAGSSPAC